MPATHIEAQQLRAPDAGAAASAGHAGAAAPPTAAELRLQRTMKLVVAALALLVVAGLVMVAMRVIYLASKPRTQAGAVAPVSARAFPPAQRLELPAGAQVRSISVSGDHLAVHYEAAGTAGIAILDLRSGRKLTDVSITPPRN